VKALLRADWLRLRRRRDLWIIFAAIGVLGAVSFLSGYRSDAEDPVPFNEAEFRQMQLDSGFFEGSTPEEIAMQMDAFVADMRASDEQSRVAWEEQQAISLQKYVFPQSILTVLGAGIAPLIALLLATTLIVGDEFRFGTIRTSFLAAADRRRFLAARCLSVAVMTAGLFALLIVVATILSLILAGLGAELPAQVTPVNVGAAAGFVGVEVLAALVVSALGIALTVLLRSGALPLLLIILATLIELFVSALPIFAPGEFLAAVPQFFLSSGIRTLLGRLGPESGGIAVMDVGQAPPAVLDLALPVVVAIVAAWGLLFLAIADRRLRTMDVVE
jgi:ABC-type transport system involved in multi-copper enzyme maturation permease subunit